MSFVPLVQLWIWVSAFASVAGWTLSALGQLNRTGYGIAFAIFVIFLWLAGRSGWFTARMAGHFPSAIFHLRFHAVTRRFRRPLPLCFAALAILIFIGGALYPPSNYTGVTYRVPRVLQWLAHGQWFWIHTPDYRMNDRACGYEWLTAPLLLFTKSDRALFLVNFIPFLLLPGLVFSVFTRLGVRARVAWQWMWLLPTGYNFLLQAGSICNDTFPAVFALAAIDFAARAWRSRRAADLWPSILAAALLTGAKASNLPLLLPWAILIFPVVPLMRRKPLATFLVILLSALVSFLPMAVLNNHFCGDWSGAKLEPAFMVMKDPCGRPLWQHFSTVIGQLHSAGLSAGRLVEPACAVVHAAFFDGGGGQIISTWDFSAWANCRPKTGRASVSASACCWWFRLWVRFGFVKKIPSCLCQSADSKRTLPVRVDCGMDFIAGLLFKIRHDQRRRA